MTTDKGSARHVYNLTDRPSNTTALTQQRDRPFRQVLSHQTIEAHQTIGSSIALVPPVTPDNASLRGDRTSHHP
ncbi:hypothetical protein H6F46_16905 [Limnothrix sp. FACHB-1083]|uniref:hypothetical protein n=1 Tax=unclassified Limnothrix TaxID=2632864 RepID=UPI001681991C|nr:MULTISPECIES: hypothetical protein [unclassified Limnothrix]MBD2162371.1 hypothetical protein [Limnothrix sp. FACHB-1083]MBD2193404.1 hypothetical protein [Limnothrix sp. FACHB-1088]